MMSVVYRFGYAVSYLMSFIFIFIGFNKMLKYENDEFGDSVNAYVAGDAYNYIINAGYATAYFVLALLFVVLGCTLLICDKLSENKGEDVNLVNGGNVTELDENKAI